MDHFRFGLMRLSDTCESALTYSAKLTYKKLQADFFSKTVPKYMKLISLK